MKRLAIVGASGHGKVVADIAVLNGYEDILFYDDDTTKKECGRYKVVGTYDDAVNSDREIFIAIGNADIRRRMVRGIEPDRLPTLLHPRTVVDHDVKLGKGTVVMAGVVINSDASIGDGVIINTCSSVDHDCVIRDFAHISVGAHLSGTIDVGEGVWIGAGATISNNITICNNCMIGVGAVVVEDINVPGTYVGVPARRMG